MSDILLYVFNMDRDRFVTVFYDQVLAAGLQSVACADAKVRI